MIIRTTNEIDTTMTDILLMLVELDGSRIGGGGCKWPSRICTLTTLYKFIYSCNILPSAFATNMANTLPVLKTNKIQYTMM